jgi:dolichol-phosphate mannosyltransferase
MKKFSGSFIIPCFNEGKNIPLIYEALSLEAQKEKDFSYEIIFVNDGSLDDTESILEGLAISDEKVKALNFSRNFGKEAATSAGLHAATGDFAMIIDADLQHPVEKITEFIEKWKEGYDVVVGKLVSSKSNIHKRIARKFFYYFLEKIQDGDIDLQGNDFRLIDRQVIDAFNYFEERGRVTRNLIDWLGFKKAEIFFEPKERAHGEAAYTTAKLFNLAINSIISNSLTPLKVAGYLGLFIFTVSTFLGIFIFVQKYILNDPFGFGFSYPAILAVVNMFLISIVLTCLGFVAMYIGKIKEEVTNRPLYVIKKNRNALKK